MNFHKNSVIFLDTGFFTDYGLDKTEHIDLLQYAQKEDILLCTSFICIEEWKSQKIDQYIRLLDDISSKSNHHRKVNIVSTEFFRLYPLYQPQEDEINKIANQVLKEFLDSNNIIIFEAKQEHIKPTWDDYFSGAPPYRRKKSKEDIPDSWIFQSGKDLLRDSRFSGIEHKLCIGNDKRMNEYLEDLGFVSTSPYEFVKKIKLEQDNQYSSQKGVETEIQLEKNQAEIKNLNKNLTIKSELDSILAYGITPEFKEIYLRILGYVYWLDKPHKNDLINEISKKGFNKEMIQSSALMLNKANLIEDTGSYYLPKNKPVCEEAANKIEDEILDLLNNN